MNLFIRNFKFENGILRMSKIDFQPHSFGDFTEIFNQIKEIYEGILTCSVSKPNGEFFRNSRGGIYIDPITHERVECVDTTFVLKKYEMEYNPYYDVNDNIPVYVIGECDAKLLDDYTFVGEVNFEGDFASSIFIVNGVKYDFVDYL